MDAVNTNTNGTRQAESPATGLEIAIIGMAGRFSGARDLRQFWENLLNGTESISFFSEEELLAAGIPEQDLKQPNYVKARGILDTPEAFDADFFSIIPREAEMMDPQHRLFLECAWEAFEDAGYVPQAVPGLVGVFTGVAVSTYFFTHVLPQEGLAALRDFVAFFSNDKDFLPTRVSYKLNLKGPSMAVNTACSSSLVATHLACKALLAGECDMALAGGASIPFPVKSGYWFQEGGILSPDGHCRAFDEQASGSVSGSGVGSVVLKRLEDAVRDNDHIYAVIKGSAVNNDGSRKVGFTAPSIDGQAEAIRLAQFMAEIEPESISYIETHGSGTPLGDPIEVRALAEVFSQSARKKFCGIGSVKANIGHAAEAAGIAGLIKTAMALRHRLLPPSLHFKTANPRLGLDNSAFYVNDRLQPWENGAAVLRAGVSSFGIGGTNAHAVLEEAPCRPKGSGSRKHQLLTLSARSATVLEKAVERLGAHLRDNRDIDLADVAFTYHVGRKAFSHRRALRCETVDEAIEQFGQNPATGRIAGKGPQIVMAFSGVGDHHQGMAAELYKAEPVFRTEVNRCLEQIDGKRREELQNFLLESPSDSSAAATAKGAIDFRRMLNRAGGEGPIPSQHERAGLVQTSLFIMEFALARLWMHWGLKPKALMGYSIGEFVAACLAEVFSLGDALKIVARRGDLIDSLPPGAMLAVPLSEQELLERVGENLSVAAVNGLSLGVVAGPEDEIVAFQQELKNNGIDSRRVQSTHAFHSKMLEPAAAAFSEILRQFTLAAPKIPYLSNVTGDWVSAGQATSPDFWATHLCRAVRFSSMVEKLWQNGGYTLLEVGPGQTLCSLALQHPAQRAANAAIVPSLASTYERGSDVAALLAAFGKLWEAGWDPDWAAFHEGERRLRVSLPGYPFERTVYRLRPDGRRDGRLRSVDALQIAPEAGPPVSSADAVATNREAGYVTDPVENEFQRRLLAIWQGLFGLDRIGIHDNFFELGGDSLRATQLASRLSQEFQVAITLRKIFENPTVALLSQVIEETVKSADVPAGTGAQVSGTAGHKPSQKFRVEISPRELEALLARGPTGDKDRTLEDIYPLTPLQEGMLFHVLSNPGSNLYMNQQVYTFQGEIAVPELRKAFEQIVAQHQILRTAFTTGNQSGPLQIVYRGVALPWEERDWRGLPTREQEERTEILLQAGREQGFDLVQPPLTRVVLIRLEDDVYRLIWSFHLILLDGWSLALLIRQVLGFYDAFRHNMQTEVVPAASYGEYVEWLRKLNMEEAWKYWQQRLQGFTHRTSLGEDWVLGEHSSTGDDYAEKTLRIDAAVTAGLQSFAMKSGLTLNTVVQGAWAFQLARRSGAEEVVFGSVVSGRNVNFPGIEAMVGLFINTLPVRVRISPETPTEAWLKGLQTEQADAHAFEFSSLIDIQRYSEVSYGEPLFESVVIFQSPHDLSLSTSDIKLTEVKSFERNSYPMSLLVIPDSELTLKLVYDPLRFSEATAGRIMEQMRHTLTQMAVAPGQPLGSIRAHSQLEKDRLTSHFNQSLEVC
jgi:acyl transferase domain-containing protein/aryl carrier-like protein